MVEHPPFQGTAFQVKVWNAMKEIPRGEVRNYTEIAVQIGHPNSARAVANACGQNPYPPPSFHATEWFGAMAVWVATALKGAWKRNVVF